MPPFYIPTTYNRTHFKLTNYMFMWLVSDYLTDALYLAIVQIFIITLVIYDAHTIHFHMDPASLMPLGQGYFAHHDYLVVCCWIQPGLLQVVPNRWRYVQIFEGSIGYMPNGAPCYCLILHSIFPHVTTTFPLP